MQDPEQELSEAYSQQLGTDRDRIPKTINIKIVYEESVPTGFSQPKQTTQLIEDFSIIQHIDTHASCLNLKSLMYDLSANFNISFENKQIHFYLQDEELFMNCGIEPISDDIKIHLKDFIQNKDGIKIKAKKMKNISILHKLMAIQNPILNDEQKEQTIKEEGSKSRRTKQRRIGYIIQKVIEWRNLYKGTSTPGSQQVKISLDEAAQQVKISKKSLDDYLFQIRFGHKYRFNFNEHYNDKVGVLRDFVRNKKKQDKEELKHRKLEKQTQNTVSKRNYYRLNFISVYKPNFLRTSNIFQQKKLKNNCNDILYFIGKRLFKMGAQQSQMSSFQIPVNKSIMGMLMRSKQEQVINMLEKKKGQNILQQPVSTNGDTLLHYAAASGQVKVVAFLTKNVPQLKKIRNNNGKLPIDLASDITVRQLLN